MRVLGKIHARFTQNLCEIHAKYGQICVNLIAQIHANLIAQIHTKIHANLITKGA